MELLVTARVLAQRTAEDTGVQVVLIESAGGGDGSVWSCQVRGSWSRAGIQKQMGMEIGRI